MHNIQILCDLSVWLLAGLIIKKKKVIDLFEWLVRPSFDP